MAGVGSGPVGERGSRVGDGGSGVGPINVG